MALGMGLILFQERPQDTAEHRVWKGPASLSLPTERPALCENKSPPQLSLHGAARVGSRMRDSLALLLARRYTSCRALPMDPGSSLSSPGPPSENHDPLSPRTHRLLRSARRHLVGREEVLRQLQRTFEHVAEGHVRTLVLSGPAGAGKTAVLETFLRRCAAARPPPAAGASRVDERPEPFAGRTRRCAAWATRSV